MMVTATTHNRAAIESFHSGVSPLWSRQPFNQPPIRAASRKRSPPRNTRRSLPYTIFASTARRRPGGNTAHSVGPAAVEGFAERRRIEVERPQPQRRRRLDDLNVDPMAQAGQLGVAPDLMHHQRLERILENFAQARGWTRARDGRVA